MPEQEQPKEEREPIARNAPLPTSLSSLMQPAPNLYSQPPMYDTGLFSQGVRAVQENPALAVVGPGLYANSIHAVNQDPFLRIVGPGIFEKALQATPHVEEEEYGQQRRRR